jgi:hypothetical protein
MDATKHKTLDIRFPKLKLMESANKLKSLRSNPTARFVQHLRIDQIADSKEPDKYDKWATLKEICTRPYQSPQNDIEVNESTIQKVYIPPPEQHAKYIFGRPEGLLTNAKEFEALFMEFISLGTATQEAIDKLEKDVLLLSKDLESEKLIFSQTPILPSPTQIEMRIIHSLSEVIQKWQSDLIDKLNQRESGKQNVFTDKKLQNSLLSKIKFDLDHPGNPKWESLWQTILTKVYALKASISL